jgi:hypothetical protein
VPLDTMRAMRPRSTIRRDSPLLIVTRSSIVFCGAPSFIVSLMCSTSPTMPPAVTTSSPFFRLRMSASCSLRWRCCGRIRMK